MPSRDKLQEFLTYTNAIIDSMRMRIQGGKEDMWYFSSFYEYMKKYNQLLTEVAKIIDVSSIVDFYDLSKVKSPYDTIPIQ